MVERVLEYDILSYYLDETYNNEVPLYYSVKRDIWDEKNAEHMAIEEIKKRIHDSPPWESITDTLEKMQDEFAIYLGCSMSLGKRNKRVQYYYESIYYIVYDALNYIYMGRER